MIILLHVIYINKYISSSQFYYCLEMYELNNGHVICIYEMILKELVFLYLD